MCLSNKLKLLDKPLKYVQLFTKYGYSEMFLWGNDVLLSCQLNLEAVIIVKKLITQLPSREQCEIKSKVMVTK
jgi:hypothetical protein